MCSVEICCSQQPLLISKKSWLKTGTHFQPDRYIYVYVRKRSKSGHTEHPWDKESVRLSYAIALSETEYAKPPCQMVAGDGNNIVPFETSDDQYDYIIQPFLLPPLIPGIYMLVGTLTKLKKDFSSLIYPAAFYLFKEYLYPLYADQPGILKASVKNAESCIVSCRLNTPHEIKYDEVDVQTGEPCEWLLTHTDSGSVIVTVNFQSYYNIENLEVTFELK